eukprot:4444693-Prymnesium_polylepis.1
MNPHLFINEPASIHQSTLTCITSGGRSTWFIAERVRSEGALSGSSTDWRLVAAVRIDKQAAGLASTCEVAAGLAGRCE